VNKTKKTERFNPEKYGMTFCPGCSGSGRFCNDAQGVNVCKVCGGFGFIKKEISLSLIKKSDILMNSSKIQIKEGR
jgi:DnaJ-class molecular chaperone